MPIVMHDLLVPLGIGLAVFLFGLKAMEIGLAEWAGPFLSRFMSRFTHTPFRGLLTGTAATVLLQSSSAVTVITIGLVNAGILSFRQTLGIVLGANIGASITADMLGIDFTGRALSLLTFAGSCWIVSFAAARLLRAILARQQPAASADAPKRLRNIMQGIANIAPAIGCLSLSVCGFACILIGMEWMDGVVPAFQERGLFVWFVEQSHRSLIWGVAAGALVTAVIQSSAAAIAITMGLAAVQAISVELGIAIVLGANIGSCSTSILACIGGTRAGRYVAYSHILLNIGGSLLFFPLISELAMLSTVLAESPYDRIAHAQSLFNILCSAVALPICYLKLNNTPTTGKDRR